MTEALASDGSLCTPPVGIPLGQAGSPQAGQPGVALWSGFLYTSLQSSVTNEVMYMPQPFMAALTASGISCALRRLNTGVQYVGGGPITVQTSQLYIGLPPHTFAACRQLWSIPVVTCTSFLHGQWQSSIAVTASTDRGIAATVDGGCDSPHGCVEEDSVASAREAIARASSIT